MQSQHIDHPFMTGSQRMKWGRNITMACALVAFSLSHACAQQPVLRVHPQYAPQGQAPIQLVKSSEPEKPLDQRIDSMPDITDNLEVIHNRSQLIVTKHKVARVFVANPGVIEVAPFSEKELAIIGTSLGTTTLSVWFEEDPNPLIYLVKTIRDPGLEEQRRIDYGKLERKIAILFPNSKVYLIPLSGKLIVKGQAANSQEAAQILQIIRGEAVSRDGSLFGPQGDTIGDTLGGNGLGGNGFGNGRNRNNQFSSFIVNMLSVPGEFNVMIKVVIAELNRSQLRQMGIDWNYLINNGRHSVSSFISGGVPTLQAIFEAGEVSVLVNALASNGTAKVLSEPSLVVLSGTPASFIAGGEFAVPTIVGIGGAQGQQTSFRGFGTSVVVTPTIVDNDLIRLQILPEFSAVNSGNAVGGIPGVDTRRINTTVELREGQTLMLSGLLSRQQATEVTRIPLLGDIPVVGPLVFNSKRATEDESELLILVTPEIVRPMEPDEVPPVPGWYVTHPTDHELYKHAMTEGAPQTEVYQLPPYGNHVGVPQEVGYYHYNPAPATPQYAPIPNANQPQGFPQSQSMPNGVSSQFRGTDANMILPQQPATLPAPTPQGGYSAPPQAPATTPMMTPQAPMQTLPQPDPNFSQYQMPQQSVPVQQARMRQPAGYPQQRAPQNAPAYNTGYSQQQAPQGYTLPRTR